MFVICKLPGLQPSVVAACADQDRDQDRVLMAQGAQGGPWDGIGSQTLTFAVISFQHACQVSGERAVFPTDGTGTTACVLTCKGMNWTPSHTQKQTQNRS